MQRRPEKVLLTGARGLIGRAVAARLPRDGWTVRPFDLVDGDDLRDADAVRRAASGCQAVVHAGAIAHDALGSPAEIVRTNVLGTWHVLLAAEQGRMSRVVSFSSVQVFGCSEGEGTPDHLPLDDDHPLRAARPYGMSKRLGEEMCEAWTARTGIPTVVLRPVRALDEETLTSTDRADLDYGAFVHVDDVAAAVACALRAPIAAHVRLTLAASGAVDATRAREVLGWEPVHVTR
jgi:UDP-glucose 4-epimerase